MIRIVPVRFQNAGRHYDFNAQQLELDRGARVIVETDRGRALATVTAPPREIADDQAPEGLKSILRVATDDDLQLATTNAARERDAFRYCQERIQNRQMEMKLVKAEYAFDGSKILFYFTADGRIDFRELVKDLAHHFHTRIEMRQIGVRDEAKLVGGLGICGRELCCCSYLTEFAPVSVKMAKEQGLALNPTKISGQCGRLLCCLAYEYETYCDLKKGMPKCGKKVTWQGQEWEVSSQQPLCRQITLRQPGGTNCTLTMDEYESGQLATPAPAPADGGQPEAVRQRSRDGGRRDRRGRGAERPERGDRPERRETSSQKPQPQPQAKPVEVKPQAADRPDETAGAGKSKRRRSRRRRSKRPGSESKGE